MRTLPPSSCMKDGVPVISGEKILKRSISDLSGRQPISEIPGGNLVLIVLLRLSCYMALSCCRKDDTSSSTEPPKSVDVVMFTLPSNSPKPKKRLKTSSVSN